MTTAFFLGYDSIFRFLFVLFFKFIFPAEIHSVYIYNIMKKCRVSFMFSSFRLFIYFHAFI